MTHRKREAAKAMFNDLVNQHLGALDQTDATWQTFRCFIQENKLNVLLADKQTSAKEQEKSLTKNDSMCEMITTSCMYLFANRKTCQDLHACLVKHLKILETRINEIILKGMVGHEDISEENQAQTLTREANKNLVQESSSSSMTGKPTKSNLTSGRVDTEATSNRPNMDQMMKSKRLVLNEKRMTNNANKKRKLQTIADERE